MWKKQADDTPGFRKRPSGPPEIRWTPEYYDADSDITFRVGFQWRGGGAKRDSIMLIYQTLNSGQWISYYLGAVPRCVLQWAAENLEDLLRLRGPGHPSAEDTLRHAEIYEILHAGKVFEVAEQRPKEEADVSDKADRPEKVDSPGWRKAVRRPAD